MVSERLSLAVQLRRELASIFVLLVCRISRVVVVNLHREVWKKARQSSLPINSVIVQVLIP